MLPKTCSVCGKLVEKYARCPYQKCGKRYCLDCIRKPIEQYIRGELNETPTIYITDPMYSCCCVAVEKYMVMNVPIEDVPLYIEIPWSNLPWTVKRLKRRLMEGLIRV